MFRIISAQKECQQQQHPRHWSITAQPMTQRLWRSSNQLVPSLSERQTWMNLEWEIQQKTLPTKWTSTESTVRSDFLGDQKSLGHRSGAWRVIGRFCICCGCLSVSSLYWKRHGCCNLIVPALFDRLFRWQYTSTSPFLWMCWN